MEIGRTCTSVRTMPRVKASPPEPWEPPSPSASLVQLSSDQSDQEGDLERDEMGAVFGFSDRYYTVCIHVW